MIHICIWYLYVYVLLCDLQNAFTLSPLIISSISFWYRSCLISFWYRSCLISFWYRSCLVSFWYRSCLIFWYCLSNILLKPLKIRKKFKKIKKSEKAKGNCPGSSESKSYNTQYKKTWWQWIFLTEPIVSAVSIAELHLFLCDWLLCSDLYLFLLLK